MDVQAIVAQFVKSAVEDPSQLKQFGIDPGSAIKSATGLDLNDDEINDVVAAIEPLLEGKGLNVDKVAEVVGDLMGNGDIVSKLTGLFSGK